MSSEYMDHLLPELVEEIHVGGLETFKPSELNEELDFEIGDKVLNNYLSKISESDLLYKIDSSTSNPTLYTVHEYQTEEVIEGLDMIESKALDEVINHVLEEPESSENFLTNIISPYFEDMEFSYSLNKRGKVLHRVRELKSIDFKPETETYSPAK